MPRPWSRTPISIVIIVTLSMAARKSKLDASSDDGEKIAGDRNDHSDALDRMPPDNRACL